MRSIAIKTGMIELPLIVGEHSMIPFDLQTLAGLTGEFVGIARNMLTGIQCAGEGFFTLHGRILAKGKTLRRPGPHTDGSYEKAVFGWGGGGGGGWKVGENGPRTNSAEHGRLYNSNSGGLILCSNFPACHGWIGEYDGLPSVGGDCSKIKLDEPIMLEPNTVYYGNNHFIHESLPMSDDVHRVFARITLPSNHCYQ